VFSSFNTLINSAATMLTLDVVQPLSKKPRADTTLVRIAKVASVGIAVISLGIAPLLQFAPEGLWQIIRIFTGFYNIPIIAVVLVGMLTTHVPALGVKLAIAFHIVTYGLLQFVFKESIDLHFLHLYAILFAAEIGILLFVGWWRPKSDTRNGLASENAEALRPPPVDMAPWRFARACSFSLLSCVVFLYLLFSPVGLAHNGGEDSVSTFISLLAVLLGLNSVVWWRSVTIARALRSSQP
jgi:SSS family solute:Na+ symporter